MDSSGNGSAVLVGKSRGRDDRKGKTLCEGHGGV